MRTSDVESSRDSRIHSDTSSKSKLNLVGKSRKAFGKNEISAFLLQRQSQRITENNIDVTPKLLAHPVYNSIEERQLTALEIIGLNLGGSNLQLMASPSISSDLKSSSWSSFKSSSHLGFSIQSDNMQMESLLSTQACASSDIDEEGKAPSQFYLPSFDPDVFRVRPETVTITLKETETFFIFEIPQLTAHLETPEGLTIKEENENYEYKTMGAGSNRKLVNAESQTIRVLTKSRGTYLPLKERKNRGVFVNNWVMHDTYATINQTTDASSRPTDKRNEPLKHGRESQECHYKLPPATSSEVRSPKNELTEIYQSTNFRDAVLIMERIIANNVFIDAQKRFIGLTEQDPYSLDLQITYSLDLLWTYTCVVTQDRPVCTFRWSYARKNILGVAYGAQYNSETKNGVLLIWDAKNPSQPARRYIFDSPISDFDWSRDRPNLIAIGFYDGTIKVIDVSSKDINVIRQSRRATSPSSSPHWQVQWWSGDEQFEYTEQIYTSNEDGRIFCYRTGEDFVSTTIMNIFRLEGKVAGVNRIDHCNIYDISISRNPGALILRRHPTSPTIYFIGSDEGCIYKCSTYYLYQHIDSFLAHDGPICTMEFSPFCSKIFLTCGADWCTRIWAEGLTEPLITLSTAMACVRYATWCPTNSTIIASLVNNEICIWNVKRKTYKPTSITVSPNSARFVKVDFTANGKQLVAADTEGVVYVYNLEGMPFPPYNQEKVLVESIEKALVTKVTLLKKLKKLGHPF